ncbi:MAG: hypothetical protein ACKPGB_24540, partial [Dolichospermum sp.]
VAAACVESLFYQSAINKVFEIVNQGNRPDIIDWEKLFSELIRSGIPVELDAEDMTVLGRLDSLKFF